MDQKSIPNKAKPIIACGLDPGSKNFGISIIKFEDRNDPNSKQKVLYTDRLKFPIDNLITNQKNKAASFTRERLYFRLNLMFKLRAYQPELITAERFIIRGRFLGGSGEKINVSLGIISELAYQENIDFELITASAWKNSWTFQTKLKLEEKVYKLMKNEDRHRFDASMICRFGVYASDKGCFTRWNSKNVEDLVNQCVY